MDVIFHPAVPTVNAVLACGQIENVGPAIARRNVTLKFIPASSQQNANVKWKRRGGPNPWSYFTNTPRFVEYEINGVYYVTITKASTGDAVDYKAEYNVADRIICTSDAATVTLIDLKDCGHLYLRSSNIIINETLEIGYYPTMSIVNHPQRYVRYWFRNDECQKGCQTDHPNSKLEEILYSNNEYVLKIHHFDNSDGGSYKLQCTSGRDTNKLTDQVNIVAPVPPSSPTLSPRETIDGFTDCIVGREDTEVEVLCKSLGGTKPLNVTIKVADTRLTVESDDSGEYRATLRLNDTLYHMAKLICSVDNYAIAVPLTAEAYIYVIKTSTTPSVYVPSRLIEGDPVNITCMVTNTRPAPTNITLLVDGSIVEGLELRHDIDTVTLLYNSWVKLTKFKRSWNKKNLTCCVYNYGEQKKCSFPQPVDLIYVQSNLHRPLPIELIGGIGGAVALVIIGTCLAVIGVCKHRKSKDDNSSPNVEEIIEYDWRHDSPSSNEEQNGADLVYLDLKFDGNTGVPVRKRWESPVLYGDIDFVKTAQSANENDCEVNEDHIYLH